MEHQKIYCLIYKVYWINLRKWNIVNDQSNANYDAENEIIYNTEVLKPNICDFDDC